MSGFEVGQDILNGVHGGFGWSFLCIDRKGSQLLEF